MRLTVNQELERVTKVRILAHALMENLINKFTEIKPRLIQGGGIVVALLGSLPILKDFQNNSIDEGLALGILMWTIGAVTIWQGDKLEIIRQRNNNRSAIWEKMEG